MNSSCFTVWAKCSDPLAPFTNGSVAIGFDVATSILPQKFAIDRMMHNLCDCAFTFNASCLIIFGLIVPERWTGVTHHTVAMTSRCFDSWFGVTWSFLEKATLLESLRVFLPSSLTFTRICVFSWTFGLELFRDKNLTGKRWLNVASTVFVVKYNAPSRVLYQL